ncbi:MAG TPA: Asp-tRNA(Asn)/Glu-tRNA(Gln) amidotransferase subunit GatC [candidate division Zixibacteria bacterium]|nr:Asp-tRNA(Asn)/Glu-tRNA(Gln) amidotransferase subunit GatC [candidate division Zixibacteria bacterium]
MPVTKIQILKAAALARLDLTREDETIISSDMAQILTYLDKIQSVEVTGPTVKTIFSGEGNVLREDIIKPSLPAEKALGNAPDRDEDFFRVPRVLG